VPVELDDVVVMVMGEEYVGQLQLAAPQILEQRRHRSAGIDHHGVTARLVGHQIGVRQPWVTHRTLDDHAKSVSG
jgi:hypothetical protein